MSNEYDKYYTAVIDGGECKTLAAFLKNVGIAFQFPDYYGFNINAFWDCIGDLSWIDERNYCMIIKNCDYFLVDENEGVKNEIYKLLEKVKQDWANVPNFVGEDIYRHKADFQIRYLPPDFYDYTKSILSYF